jgi:uncharacterized protein YjdB/N-acetylneuraminic acid mutarotase
MKNSQYGKYLAPAPSTCAGRARAFWVVALLAMLSACGGAGGGSGAPPPVTAPSNLSYPAAPTLSVGTTITALTPTVTGQVTDYNVNPALPAGLSISSSSGVISGTPTEVAAKAAYKVTATNPGGSASATVSIEVVAAAATAPSDLNYPTPPTLVVGTKMASLAPKVAGQVTSYRVEPALPAGLSLNSTSGVISGTPTAVAAKTDYTVTATNAAGSTTATVSIVVMASAPAYTAKSGVAQKGPLIQGSTVTAQELDPRLSPTGLQFTYQILTNFGTFSPTSTFTSQYLGLIATGYYFDELANAVSTGPITLNAYSDLSADSVLNVNLLTTLEYQRIQHLVTESNMTFAAARAQAETEVLAALNIPAGSYGSFDSLNLTGSSDGDYILAAISSLFVYGNSAGPLNARIASFQSDIGTNGVITNPATTAALVAAAKGVNPAAVASNLTRYYSSQGVTFIATNISDWIAQSGDGVIGRDAFSVADATPSTAFTFPSYVVSQFAGLPVSVTAGQLTINGTAVTGTVSFNKGDVVAVSPSIGNFPNGALTSYLVTGTKNLARVTFVSGLVSILVTPNTPSIPLGLTQQFTATGTFSDTSTADLTRSASWTSGTPAVATVNSSSGLANVLKVGSTVITATSGSISGTTTLIVTAAALESIAITPNPITVGAGLSQQLTATGTYSDGTTQNVTTAANWTSDAPSVATVGPSTGLATGVSMGSATISATVGSVAATAPLSVVTLVSIAITPDPAKVALGSTQQLTATGTFSDGSTQSVTSAANWTSDASSVASVGSSTGLVTGVSAGSATISAAIGSITSTTPLSVLPGVWASAGSMSTARVNHAATLLSDGTVLVSGGAGNNLGGTGPATMLNILSSSEIYIPGNGWGGAGSMTTSRTYHTSTLLPNGTVLVAGGYTQTGKDHPATDLAYVGSAEIYNPASHSWAATASMAVVRAEHAATLLPDGTVLVVGGVGSSVVTTAEVYNPATATWTTTASMKNGRYQHTVTLLPNGKVLAAGGLLTSDDTDTTATAEIYDPVAKTWTVTGSMTTARASATATLLHNGTVLVAGGYYNTQRGMVPLGSAEIYDPAAGTWTATGNMLTVRYGHTANPLPDGTVLAAGGASGTSQGVSSSAEIYDPVAGTWVATGSMIASRSGHTATLLASGEPLLAGGSPFSSQYPLALYQDLLSSSEIYQDLESPSNPALSGSAPGPRQGSGTIANTATISRH